MASGWSQCVHVQRGLLSTSPGPGIYPKSNGRTWTLEVLGAITYVAVGHLWVLDYISVATSGASKSNMKATNFLANIHLLRVLGIRTNFLVCCNHWTSSIYSCFLSGSG